ncbi:uncharacterized protein CIMG_12045 [Coccidioides immitis RS]|uniref:Uncharacterized protein n=1 Tax=Coccidioides immitis (strain RS) TaxID=246410 RepID=A0A0D8JUQ1_COCIM|nr:uncharacterized protein CIMG_12045 [Coccidioides immitis RS]KJF60869.1 hypothetical protein CIMG_12045 [Coccidioides immitis RS]
MRLQSLISRVVAEEPIRHDRHSDSSSGTFLDAFTMASFNSPAKSLAAVVKLALSLEFRVRVTRRAGHAGARDFAHPPRPQRAAALIGPGVGFPHQNRQPLSASRRGAKTWPPLPDLSL